MLRRGPRLAQPHRKRPSRIVMLIASDPIGRRPPIDRFIRIRRSSDTWPGDLRNGRRIYPPRPVPSGGRIGCESLSWRLAVPWTDFIGSEAQVCTGQDTGLFSIWTVVPRCRRIDNLASPAGCDAIQPNDSLPRRVCGPLRPVQRGTSEARFPTPRHLKVAV